MTAFRFDPVDYNRCALLHLFQRPGQLIRAGSPLHPAFHALEESGYLLCALSFHEPCDALQVSVAAAGEGNVLYDTILDIKVDAPGAGAFGLICVMHEILLLFLCSACRLIMCSQASFNNNYHITYLL